MRKFLLAALFMLLSSITLVLARPTQESSAAFEARGVRIVDNTKPGEDEDLRAFNWFPGTSVAILVKAPTLNITGWDHGKSKLTVMRDDKSKNLLSAKKLSQFSQNGVEMNAMFGKDGKSMMFEVKAAAIPAEGATKVTVGGGLAIKTATKQKTHETTGIHVAKDATFEVGPYSFSITEVGTSTWADQFAFTLSTKQDLGPIITIEAFDKEGKSLEAREGMTSSSGWEGNMTSTKEILLNKEASEIKIVIKEWSDQKIVILPFEIEAGLGL